MKVLSREQLVDFISSCLPNDEGRKTYIISKIDEFIEANGIELPPQTKWQPQVFFKCGNPLCQKVFEKPFAHCPACGAEIMGIEQIEPAQQQN